MEPDMTEWRPSPPPIGIARLGGAMYLSIILLGLFAEIFVRHGLIVANDAMATAANIRAHEFLWRCGVASELVSLMCVTVLMLTWLAVLRPVNRDLTYLAIVFSLTAHAVGAVGDRRRLLGAHGAEGRTPVAAGATQGARAQGPPPGHPPPLSARIDAMLPAASPPAASRRAVSIPAEKGRVRAG